MKSILKNTLSENIDSKFAINYDKHLNRTHLLGCIAVSLSCINLRLISVLYLFSGRQCVRVSLSVLSRCHIIVLLRDAGPPVSAHCLEMFNTYLPFTVRTLDKVYWSEKKLGRPFWVKVSKMCYHRKFINYVIINMVHNRTTQPKPPIFSKTNIDTNFIWPGVIKKGIFFFLSTPIAI